jgi:hypothetical protein
MYLRLQYLAASYACKLHRSYTYTLDRRVRAGDRDRESVPSWSEKEMMEESRSAILDISTIQICKRK